MSSFLKAIVLSASLVAGATMAAQAQTSDDVSALPPGGGPAMAPTGAPSGNYPGPNLGGGTNSSLDRVSQGPIAPSGAYPGPAAGASDAVVRTYPKPAGYDSDPSMAPYSRGIGAKLN